MFLDVAQADAAAFANFAVEGEAAARRAALASGEPTPPPAPARRGRGTEQPRSTMQAYTTRDGHTLLLMALERKFFVRLAEAVGRPDLLALVPEDQYLASGNQEIDDALCEIIATKDIGEWMQLFAAADVPVVPVNENAQVLDDPQLAARIEWLEADDDTVTMKTPVRGLPTIAAPTRAPAIGQDTVEVLASIGVDQAEIDRLERDGVIRVAHPSDD
jgi:crotonobetainyl-CoA:carnitine CoA-transferase CaiB-like acyl-CoA transferase